MVSYKMKLNNLHKELITEKTMKEGMISDYAFYQFIKQAFDAQKLTFYEFGLLKQIMEDFLKRKGIK